MTDARYGAREFVALSTGIHLGYVDSGPRDGEVLLLLHGVTNSADSWTRTAQALRRLLPGRRLIAPDLRGHGCSSLPPSVDDYRMTDFADDVRALLDALGIEHVTIVGHSMGSMIAVELALACPDRVDRLVLIGTTSDARRTPILGDWLLHDVIEERWHGAVTPLDADPDAVAWLQTYWTVYAITPEISTDLIAEQAAHLPIRTWHGATLGILAFDRTEQLRAMGTPTLVLWGTQDPFFRRADQDVLVDALRDAARIGGSFAWKQYGVRPLPASGLQEDDLGHNLTWEIPEVVAEDVAAFVVTGSPTDTAYRTDDSGRADRLVVEPGKAPIVRSRANG